MFSTIWHTLFFDPVYNGLIFFVDIVPGGDVGLAIVAITVVVKLVLLPLSINAVRTQKLMKEIEPKLKEVREKNKDDKEAQARAMMEIYKEYDIKPFSSILLMFLQIPIIIALYFSVSGRGDMALPMVDAAILYSFVPMPEAINTMFLGIIDVAAKSMPLAILAGVTQFIHARFSMPAPEPKKDTDKPDFKADFARTMHLQMRYVLPVVIFVVSYSISAAVALYFTISNLSTLAQEYFILRKHR